MVCIAVEAGYFFFILLRERIIENICIIFLIELKFTARCTRTLLSSFSELELILLTPQHEIMRRDAMNMCFVVMVTYGAV